MAATVDATALAALLADPEVTSVSEDRVLYPVLYDTPGITRASMAWAEGFRGAGQTVAILDTGVDKTHPFFTGKVVAEACFSQPGPGGTTYCPNGQSQQIGPGAGVNCPDSSLGCWHGTHVAGIAAGKYGVLAANTGGIAPDASVIAIQVFQRQCFADGSCRIVAYESDLIRALEHVYSLRNTYAIASANMSLGGANYNAPCDSESPAMTSVVQTLRSAGIATVAAAGNESTINAISFPGCLTAAVSVGSTTKQNQISSFSNSASFLSLLAPGSGITSSVPGGGFGGASGTSMATPHVAGAFAVFEAGQAHGHRRRVARCPPERRIADHRPAQRHHEIADPDRLRRHDAGRAGPRNRYHQHRPDGRADLSVEWANRGRACEHHDFGKCRRCRWRHRKGGVLPGFFQDRRGDGSRTLLDNL